MHSQSQIVQSDASQLKEYPWARKSQCTECYKQGKEACIGRKVGSCLVFSNNVHFTTERYEEKGVLPLTEYKIWFFIPAL